MTGMLAATSWTVGSVVVSLLTNAGALIGIGVLADRAGRRSGVLRRTRRTCWWIGIAAAVVAVSPPLDALAHTSFVGHMAQHLVLVLVAAPALVAARPDLVLLRALPRRLRDRMARSLMAARPRASAGVALGLLGFVGWLWATHMTSIYDRSLELPVLHAAEHALYLLTAMAFWVPFVLQVSRSEVMSIVAPLVSMMIAMPASSLLAFVLLNADEPRYAAYSLADERAGAAAMWVGMSVALLGAALLRIGRAMPERTGSGLSGVADVDGRFRGGAP